MGRGCPGQRSQDGGAVVIVPDPLQIICPYGWLAYRERDSWQAFYRLLALGMWLPIFRPLLPRRSGGACV